MLHMFTHTRSITHTLSVQWIQNYLLINVCVCVFYLNVEREGEGESVCVCIVVTNWISSTFHL